MICMRAPGRPGYRLSAGWMVAVWLLAWPMPGGAGQADDPAQADAGGYVFDASLFRGGRISASALERFNKADTVAPGIYKADIFVNQQFFDRVEIEFVAVENGGIQPCLASALLERAGVATVSGGGDDAGCRPIEETVAGGSSHFDLSRLRLDLSIPQSRMKRVPRGYVNPADLDAGSAIGFINYIGNIYQVSYSDTPTPDPRSAYLSLSGGVNLGAWQYRQQSSLTYSLGTGTHWTNLRSYVQRPLPALDSQLSVGQIFTTGRFFSGLSYTGVSLSTDDRMLPDSMRGYAPIVRGVANTNARVSIRQNGNEIYQTTVAPGPFEITDLYPTSYNGDLEVEVIEANGVVSRFSVPFSAVPESMRPGVSRYNFSLGRTRGIGEDTLFGDLVYQRGLSNTLTANGGLRVADGYYAAVLGGVYGSRLGAFGLDVTYSRASMPGGGTDDGWMAHVSWSRTFQPTQTSVSLAGYRYSTAEYRDLADVAGLRAMADSGGTWESSTYMQRNRVELTLNQSMGRSGTLFLSGSVQDYRDGRKHDTQLQMGYGRAFSNGASVNVSVARQRVGGYQNWAVYGYDASLGPGRTETVTTLSVSLPLERQASARTPTLSTSWTHSDSSGSQYQATASGMADEAQTLSYSAGVSHTEQPGQTTWNASLQKRLPSASVGASVSRGDTYWQASGNAQGALAVHSGGITFGPYLADTFALVEAKGAEGARVLNSQGARIDGNGYALVPAVTPYRYNSILLDPQGMEGKVELQDGEQRVAPYAGAAVKVVFKTRGGHALLIRARMADGQGVPLGTDVYDETGGIVGMVGQGSQVYVRTENPKGRLSLKWGDHVSEQCSLPYDTAGFDLNQPLIKLDAVCAGGAEQS